MLDLVYQYRVLLGKCSSGAGLTMDEIERLTNLEATFVAGEVSRSARAHPGQSPDDGEAGVRTSVRGGVDDRRAAEGRRFRRERVALRAVVRGGGGDLHDSVTIAELTLGGLVCTGAPYAEAGTAIDIVIDDPVGHRSYRFKGRVQWVGDDADDDYRLGVELTGTPVMIRYSAPQTIDPVLARLAA